MAVKCRRCGHEFPMKYLLKRHLGRKDPCKCTKENVEINVLLQELEEGSCKDFACKHCNKTFTKSNNRYRHQKACPKQSNQVAKDNVKELKDVVSDLQQELAALKNLINTQNNSNNINSNNNNNNNNNNINIILNNFGHESCDHITEDFMKHCIMNDAAGMKSLMEKIHFSTDVPQNRTIRMKNVNKNLVEVTNNQQWVVKDADEALEVMMKKGFKILNNYYTNPNYGIMDIDINELDLRIQKFLQGLLSRNTNDYKALRRRILALIIEHTTRV